MGVFCLALDYAALVVLAKDHGIIITGIINIVIGVIALAEYLGHNLNYNKAQQGVPPLRATSGARVNADVRTENERCGTRQSKGATATHFRW